MEYNVFISHSSKDQEQVKLICAYLEDKGFKCFVSYRDIPSGVSYPGAITRAMRESEMLLLVLSKDSNESTQVDRELTMANDQKKKMSCFRLADIEYSDDKAYLMSGVNWLNAFPEPEKHYFELLQDICRQLGREVPKKEETEEERRERYERRLGKMLLAASNGDSYAQFDLGKAYDLGDFGLNSDYEAAFEWFLKSAKKGNIKAENTLGVYYCCGNGVEKNLSEAIKWYRLSALSGNEVAQYNLGRMFYEGEGIEQDFTQAVKWFTLSADQGYSDSQVNLGNCYIFGSGVEQNYEKAVELFAKAAEADNDWAQRNLANCYRDGKGVEQDIMKCIELLEKAANNNDTRSMLELAEIYERGKYIDKNPEKAFEYVKKAADKGNGDAYYELAKYYDLGIGCDEDPNLSFSYLTKAAEERYANSDAQKMLGYKYSQGVRKIGLAPDPQKAKYWYEKAIENGNRVAMVDLGLCYSAGGCLPLDDKKAAELFRQAAEAGYARGQFFLSDEYQQGDGVEQNDVEAFNWCLKSAEQEYAPAMARLGEYYFYGFGTEQDFSKAVEWLDKASHEGENDAQYLLGVCYEKGYGMEKDRSSALTLYKFASDDGNSKAKEAFNRLLKHLNDMSDKGDNESKSVIGSYYINIEDYDKAIEYLTSSAENGYTPAYNNLAWALHLQGKDKDALPWAEKAVENEPEIPAAVDTLASVYQELGRLDEALTNFEKCLEILQEQGDEYGVSETKDKIDALKQIMKS